jgi:hypothetical protein
MLSVIRPVFEVVKEGRIFNKIKHLQSQIVSAFFMRLVYVWFFIDFMTIRLNLNKGRWRFSPFFYYTP